MNKLEWYKRNPSKFIGGTVGMTFEVKGAYSIVLDLIYDGGGSCPDDGPWIANILGVGMTTRRWNKIKGELVDRGKLVVKDGRLSNPAADRIIAQNEILSRSKTGKSSGNEPRKNPEKQAEKTRENLVDLFAANGLTPLRPPESAHLPARARESQSQSQRSSRLDKSETITWVQKIADALGQDRGRYWETDFARMVDQDDLAPEDILSAAVAHQGGSIRGLNALRGLARKKREDRVCDDPVEPEQEVDTVTLDEWKDGLIRLALKGVWSDRKLGPMPGTPGYRGPPDLEAAFLDGWRKQGSHPIEELDRNNHFRAYPADDPDMDRRARWSTIT